MTKHDSDMVFWERLEEMPHWEAEQECVLRRNALVERKASIEAQRKDTPVTRYGIEAKEALFKEIKLIDGQMSKLNDRISALRRLQTAVNWRASIKAVCTPDVYEAVCVYHEQQFGHIDDQRTRWNVGSKKS